jgi:hypothetical protein
MDPVAKLSSVTYVYYDGFILERNSYLLHSEANILLLNCIIATSNQTA